MAGRYHGRRVYHVESAQKRAEREEQRFRRRHDRLHRMRLLHPSEPYGPNRADVAYDDELPDADVLYDFRDDDIDDD